MENFFFVSPVAALNKPVAPRLARRDQSVDTTAMFNRFGKPGLPFRMSRVLHRKAHGVIGEGDKKGGSISIGRLKTSAIVWLWKLS